MISGGVRRPFWDSFPFCNIHISITPDILHQLYQGIIKHMVDWCSSLMDDAELDHRVCTLPPCFGLRHFKGGWSRLSQISGKEQKDMARILLGCLVGKVPDEVLICYRALLDFIYIAQYPTHDDDSLRYLEDVLDLFHGHKHIFWNLAFGNTSMSLNSTPWSIMLSLFDILEPPTTTIQRCSNVFTLIWQKRGGGLRTSGMRSRK